MKIMEEGNTIAERINGVDLLKNGSSDQNGVNSCNSNASTSNNLKNGTDAQFKTPSIPIKKANMPLKKRLTTPEGDSDGKDVAGLTNELANKSLINEHSDNASTSSDPSTKTDEKLPSTMCPNSKKYFINRHPKLSTKSIVDSSQDLFEEMIVDDFSLILFEAIEDYKVFKVHEDEVSKREREEEEIKRLAQAAQAAADEATRQVKLKKKGRKSKAEIEKAQRLLRKEERRKIRERRQMKKERHRLKVERGEIQPKQETQEQKERREQRMNERQERHRLKREEKEKKRQLKVAKKSQERTLNTNQTVASRPQFQQNPISIGISDLAQQQRQRLDQLMRNKPITPNNGMEELIASAALIFATNPNESEMANAVLSAVQTSRGHLGSESQTPANEGTNQSTASTSNENGRVDLSRPSSTLSGPKRPTSTASIKRPLSELDPQQQLNGPTNKMIKLEDSNDYRKELLAMQAAISQQGSRRNSLQNQQQMPPQLNFPPFAGMQPMLNGMLPSTTDPNFRFAVPQHLMPMAAQRTGNPQQPVLDPAQLAALGSLPIAGLLPHGLIPAGLNSMMQLNPAAAALAASRSQANPATQTPSASSANEQQTTSSALNKPFTNPVAASANPLANNPQLSNAFAHNPDFAATLQQALSAMNAVDPTLLTLNQHLLGIGAQNLSGQVQPLAANALLNQLNEAQKQLEQLSQRQPQRTPMSIQQQLLAQQQAVSSSAAQQRQQQLGIKPPFMQQQQPQIRTAQIPISNIIPSKLQPENKKPSTPKQTPPRRSQNPSASNSQIPTPAADHQLPPTQIGVNKNPSINPGGLPVGVVGQMSAQNPGARPEAMVQPTIPLSRPITPTFASSIGMQFPPGTALASQLAGAAKLGGKATFSTRTSTDRWNRLHVDVCETLQKLFADNPETCFMDDGSREGQTCAQFPREWRVPANSQALHLQTPNKDQQNVSTNEVVKNSSEIQNEPTTSESSHATPNEALQSRSKSPVECENKAASKADETTNANRIITQQPTSSLLPQTNPQIQELAQARLSAAASNPAPSMAQMKAPTVVAQQQAQEQRALLQQQQMGIPVSGISSVGAQPQLTAEALLLRQQLMNNNAQEAQKLALQQQILASQANQVQNRQLPAGFPFAQKTPSRTPVPPQAQPSSSNAAMNPLAALHPSLASVSINQGSLTAGVPATNSMASESAKLMNLIYQQQQQNAQEQQKKAEQLRLQQQQQQQVIAGREMAKKSNASNLRMKEEEQKQLQQRQQLQANSQAQQQLLSQAMGGLPAEFANAQALANSYTQGLPASTQLMLQQLIAGQNSQPLAQMQAALAGSNPGLANNLLETLALQNRQMAQLPQQNPAQQRPAQLNAQQLANNFPGLQAQIAQSIGQQIQQQQQMPPVSALNSLRAGAGPLDSNQLLSLFRQQQAMESQANRPQTSQLSQQPGQSNAAEAANAEILRQLQQSMLLERSVNPLLQQQQMSQQNAQQTAQQNLLQQLQLAQAQQAQQIGLAPMNQNQLSSLVNGMPNLMDADMLMRQFSGQQNAPPNLQRSAQDRQQKAEQHRQFREQLIAAANNATNSSAAGPLPPNLYQMAALQNGQTSAAQLASLQQQQQQVLASQLKNPASLMGTPQKN